jgi:glycosyltransferase involved in cell wall biosynthesis
MDKVKIAHIITDLDIGGAEMMLLKMLRNFENDKYEHFVISLHPEKNRLCDTIEKEGFKVYLLNFRKRNFVVSFIKLLSILKREKPHIAHNYLFHADLFGRIAAKAMRVPIVISSLRSVEIGGRLHEILLRMTDFYVDRVTAVSKTVANAHISKGTTKKNKIHIIYNGVELKDNQAKEIPSIRRNMDIKDDNFLLLTVGGLRKVKGHIFLFNALKMLKEKGLKFKLMVVGKGSERRKLEKEIIERDLGSEVALIGEREDISELLAASDAFVLASLWEGLPNTLLEAMAAGLPVIATCVGGIPEVVDDNKTGLLVEPKDSDTLAEAIGRIIEGSELRERLAQNARDYAIKNFDIKKTVSDTEKLYEELLKEHGKD